MNRVFLFLIGFFSYAAIGFSQTTTFSTPGAFNYTVPNYTGPFQPGDIIEKIELTVTIVGGGGGGGRGQGAGGGGGGQVRVVTFEVNSGDVLSGSVGAGGLGRANSDGAGANGGASSFNGIVASGGIGGGGSTAGNGGASGGGSNGGLAGVASGSGNSALRAGGGGGGAGGIGLNGNSAGPGTKGGNGGVGISGFGGGGGAAARRQGANPASNNLQTQGEGSDGGSNGSNATATNAQNGGGGGGGWARGGNGGDGLVIITINYSILPVEFGDVNAIFDTQNQVTNILWSTAKEWNNSHFEIERSIGGVGDFKKIGEVAGKGWSDDLSNYAHVDNTLPNGKGIAYYRIRQVDFDGKSSISKVISVQIQVAKVTKNAWQAYPNPVRDNQINIKLLDYSAFSGQKIQVRIVHANMMVASQELGSVEELNAFLQQQISRIPKGVFVIEIKWADKIEHLKMLKAL